MLNIDINETIDNLPEQARTTVLYSLVGSLNTRMIGGAQRIVNTCDKLGEDVHGEINEGFLATAHESAALASNGSDDWFATLRVLNHLRNHLKLKLATTLNQPEEEVLPISGTLNFMTESPAKPLPKEVVDELVAALGIEGLDAATIQQVDKLDKSQRKAALIAIKERVLDVALQLPGDAPDESAFDHLSNDVALRILDKMNDALNKARNDAVLAILRRSSRANLGDIPMIQAAIKEVTAAIHEATDQRIAA